MTPTDQVIAALIAKGYGWASGSQQFMVFLRDADQAYIGLETFDDGSCVSWTPLTFRGYAEDIIAAIP